MIKTILGTLSFIMPTLSYGQALGDKYLHFTEYCYWDTMVYKISQSFYYERDNEKIIQSDYPVLQYVFSVVDKDTRKDSFQRRSSSYFPYRYIQKNTDIYLQCTDVKTGHQNLHQEYKINGQDTVFGLANKSDLDALSGLSVSGYSYYRGEVKVKINNGEIAAYHFVEEHSDLLHPEYYTKEVFLEQKTLTPVKFIITYFNPHTKQRTLFRKVHILSSTSNSLPDYKNTKAEDLVRYEDGTLVWTKRQQQDFLGRFPPDARSCAKYVMGKLNGRINFFKFDQTMYCKKLLIDCEGK